MHVFQFIKYFAEDFQNYLNKISHSNAILAFDLEDSIQDINEIATSSLKAKYRSILKTILADRKTDFSRPIAVRVNSLKTNDFMLDIEMLGETANREIHTIMFPKIETPDEIMNIVKILRTNAKIHYSEIAVFIETVRGVANLPSIVSLPLKDFIKIIFGHADFNFDNQLFPFFHQDSDEYWRWVREMVRVVEGGGRSFINSPCFCLDDDLLFNHILLKLESICKKEFGQLTLNYHQSLLCDEFIRKRPRDLYQAKKTTPDSVEYAGNLIKLTEKFNQGKGLTIINKSVLVTPQEYKMAKIFLKKMTHHERN